MKILFRILRYLKAESWLVTAGLGASLLFIGTTVVMPQVMRDLVDQVFVGHRMERLSALALVIVGLAVGRGGLLFAQIYSAEMLAQRVLRTMRNQLLSHLQRLEFGFFDGMPTGQIIARITSDIDSMRRFLGFALSQMIVNVLLFFGVLLMCLHMHPKLALLALSTAPFISFFAYRFGRRVGPAFRGIREQVASVTTVLQENIAGVRVVKAYVRERHEIEKFVKEAVTLLERNVGAARLWSFYFPLMDLIAAGGTLAILWYGGGEVIRGRLTLGEFVAFEAYFMLMSWPIMALGFVVSMTQGAVVAGGRIFELIDREPAIRTNPGARSLPDMAGRVEFRNVTFAYAAREDSPAVTGISLTVEPGQTVAVIGPTGCGKSSVVNLIPRFYDVTEGAVLVDGTDVRELDLESLRRSVGIVLQDTFLFSASLRDNIAFGRPDATDDEVRAAARQAAVAPFAEKLENTYDTEVGERGTQLSGGERQRVAIARALLLDPRILILDDCTSSVDVETEAVIQQALRILMEGRTTFIIAQRLSTLRTADLVVVLKDGRIVQRGSHEELLQTGGSYAEMMQVHVRTQEAVESQLADARQPTEPCQESDH
jgi:ATP-binding cassette subfamily B protein